MDTKPQIKITPTRVMLDDEIEIIVTCLRPYQDVTLMCRILENGMRFFSYAYYRSNDSGLIDVKTVPALSGGSYEGVEPMGLIWSQKQEPGQKPGRRLAKIDVTTPIVTHVYVCDGKMSPNDCLTLISSGYWLAYTTCDRIHMADGVDRIEVHQGRLRGTMFVPPGPGPHPGVIDLFGAVGGTVEHRSALLASRGIAAFAVCYFTPGKGDGLVTDIEYFEEAIEYLLRHPRVKQPYVGVIGVSKGAELALIISSLCHKIKACIEINGVDVFTLVDHSYKGEIFPCLQLDINWAQNTKEGIEFKNTFFAVTPEECEQYGIPVERGSCDYLLLHGEDDRCNPAVIGEHVVERLRRRGKSNYRMIVYPETGHLLEPPHSPHFYATYHAMFQMITVWGGNAPQHARAQTDAWKQVLHFFKTKLGDEQITLQNKL